MKLKISSYDEWHDLVKMVREIEYAVEETLLYDFCFEMVEYRILEVIYKSSELRVSQTEISKKLSLPLMSINNALNKLFKKGYIVSVFSDDDPNTNFNSLTLEGMEIYNTIRPQFERFALKKLSNV